MAVRKRDRLFIDPKVQGDLMLRAAMYWGFALLSIAMMLLCWRVFTGPKQMFWMHLDDLWRHYGPAVAASLILLPLVATDVIRLSNKFCGPMMRLRGGLRNLGRGEEQPEIRFRAGDCWQELADEFNTVRNRMERLERELAELKNRARQEELAVR